VCDNHLELALQHHVQHEPECGAIEREVVALLLVEDASQNGQRVDTVLQNLVHEPPRFDFVE